MENLTIVKDKDEQLMPAFTDYTPADGDSTSFKFAKHWGDVPLQSISGTVDTANKAFVFDLSAKMTADIVVERDVSEYVYEIEGVVSGKKKVFKQGNLFIRNTL